MQQNLREFLKSAEANGVLCRVPEKVQREYEISTFMM